MSLISFFYLIFVSKERWFRVKKTLKSRSSTVWSLFLFKYSFQSCLSSSRLFFLTFWLSSSVSLFSFRSIYLLSSFYLRTYNILRILLNQKILSLSFMTLFSTDSFLLFHRIFLFCSFSCLISSWFVRNFLKTHQMRFDRLSTSCRSRSSHLDNLNE